MSIKHSFPYSVPFNTRKRLIYLGIVILLYITAWIFSYNDMFGSEAAFLVTWIAGPLMIVYLVFAVWTTLERKPALRVDEKGLWFRFPLTGGRFVPWKDVEGFKQLKNMLYVLVNNPEHYLAQRGMSRNQVIAAKVMWEKHGTPVTVALDAYEGIPENIVDALEQGLKKFKQA